MAGGDFGPAPSLLRLDPVARGLQRGVGRIGVVDIGPRQAVADRSLYIERAGGGPERMRREPALDPFGILGVRNAEGRGRRRGRAEPAARFLRSLAARR